MQAQGIGQSKNNYQQKNKKETSLIHANDSNEIKIFDTSTESGQYNDSSHFEKSNFQRQGGIHQKLNFTPASSSSAVVSSVQKDPESGNTNSSRILKTASGKEM